MEYVKIIVAMVLKFIGKVDGCNHFFGYGIDFFMVSNTIWYIGSAMGLLMFNQIGFACGVRYRYGLKYDMVYGGALGVGFVFDMAYGVRSELVSNTISHTTGIPSGGEKMVYRQICTRT